MRYKKLLQGQWARPALHSPRAPGCQGCKPLEPAHSLCSFSTPPVHLPPPGPRFSQAWPHQTPHPLPSRVPWLPKFARPEVPFLLPGKLELIFESPFLPCLLQEALPPQHNWRFFHPFCWSHSWLRALVVAGGTAVSRAPGPPNLDQTPKVGAPTALSRLPPGRAGQPRAQCQRSAVPRLQFPGCQARAPAGWAPEEAAGAWHPCSLVLGSSATTKA